MESFKNEKFKNATSDGDLGYGLLYSLWKAEWGFCRVLRRLWYFHLSWGKQETMGYARKTTGRRMFRASPRRRNRWPLHWHPHHFRWAAAAVRVECWCRILRNHRLRAAYHNWRTLWTNSQTKLIPLFIHLCKGDSRVRLRLQSLAIYMTQRSPRFCFGDLLINLIKDTIIFTWS